MSTKAKKKEKSNKTKDRDGPSSNAMLRSDDMTFCEVYLQHEVAYDVLNEIGKMGCVEFVDMTPDVSVLDRNYVSEVKRLSDLKVILFYIKSEMDKYDIWFPPNSSEPDVMEPHELNEYETRLETLESKFRNIEQYHKNLLTNLKDVAELYYVMSHMGPILGDVELRADTLFGNTAYGDDGDADFNRVLNVRTGVVARAKCKSFETMIWRVSRGNLYYKTASEDRVFVDPFTDHEVRKVAFIVVCQGEALNSRLDKICAGYHATLYSVPRTLSDRYELTKKLEERLKDMLAVLKKTKYSRCKVLRSIGRAWEYWDIQVDKTKAIYTIMNLFSLDITRNCLIGQCWVPTHEMPKIMKHMEKCSENARSQLLSFLTKIPTNETPPTYHRTNKFTNGFQALISAFGDSQYREINPGLYTIITFPFLFAVMFGDVGHAIIMLSFALWMLKNEQKFMTERSTNEIWNIFFGGRYIILLMGLFSVFTGAVYNDIFSKRVAIQKTFWINQFPRSYIETKPLIDMDPAHKSRAPYYFGVDPFWGLAKNRILFDNSIKMKMSIILGVSHMMFGLWLSLVNHLFYRHYYAIILEFIPQLLFLTCLFMWLVFLIFFKWFTYGARKEGIDKQPGCAPLILIQFIDMMLMSKTENKDPNCHEYMFNYQEEIQKILVYVALGTVPIMLLGSPLYQHFRHSRLVKQGKAPKDDDYSFSEIMIHQSIHTIEFVLSTISHTASYLRLWALSLAHAQLSDMLWNMIFARIGLRAHNRYAPIIVYCVFAIWATFSISILVLMEGLSAFLHTLRLHWVEFMSKFFVGGGRIFVPFSFKTILDDGS